MPRAQRRRRGSGEASKPKAAPVAPGGLIGGQYKPLSDGDVEKIIDAAKTVLERTGIEVMDSPCREVFRKAGCRIDADANRVYIDHKTVEEGVAKAANQVLLAGRTPDHDLMIGGTKVFMGTGGSAVNILDLEGNYRETVLLDNYNIGRLVDRLDNIHFYMRPVVSRDIPSADLDINQYYACMAATPKHVMANAYMPENVPEQRRMAEIMAGGKESLDARPTISYVNCWTVSPLRYAFETLEVLDAIIASGLPVVLSSAPQSGATSPVTLAGTLVQIFAEELSGIVYVNLLNPGHPVILGCVPAQADLRTGSYTGGSAEAAVMNAACAQIGQRLNLPVYNSTGITDSKVPDAQAASEKAITGLAAALAGTNYIHHSAGFLESMLAVAYEQYVIDNDINGQIMRMVRGVEVSEESLCVDVIDQVCRGDGHYLGHPQTLSKMHTEYLYPEVMDRNNREVWTAAGAKDVREAARDYARKILTEHWPTVIPPEIDAEVRKQFNILLPESAMRPAA